MAKLDGALETLRIVSEMSLPPFFLLGSILLVVSLPWYSHWVTILAVLAVAVALIVWLLVDVQGFKRVREGMLFRDTAESTAETRRYAPIPEGTELVMPFRRHRFRWTRQHVEGEELRAWEFRGDALGDKVLYSKQAYHPVIAEGDVPRCPVSAGAGADAAARCPVLNGEKGGAAGSPAPSFCAFEEFQGRLRAEGKVDKLPDWVDFELLDVGCKFFASFWPFVSYQFAWAVMGGFGAEQAAAVLLRSRYWAASGPSGRIDTWRRLRETLCFLHDVCAHGADGFRPEGVSIRACLFVRWLHCRARANIWSSEEAWDYATLGEPINQAELIGTLIGSSLLLLDGLEEMAFFQALVPARSRAGFLHLWAVVGHLFGIEEELNPCRDEKRCRVVMESLFTFGIPEKPDPALTHALNKHVIDSVRDGIAFTMGSVFKTMAPSSGTVAMPAWMFLGKRYGEAVGLPEPSVTDQAMGWCRRLGLGVALCFHLRMLNGVERSGGRKGVLQRTLEALMQRLFSAAVKQIRADQPSCRFGVLPSPTTKCTQSSPDGAAKPSDDGVACVAWH